MTISAARGRRGLHHVEIWVAEPPHAGSPWAWLLSELGYTLTAEWPGGQSWGISGTYLTFTTSPNVSHPQHDRRRPGVNHLAFHAGSPADVDALMVAASAHGWSALYTERYPHAGGPDHYAGWLEDAAGFKVELVADPR